MKLFYNSVLFLMPALALAAISEPVKLDSGAVSGVAGKSAEVRVFKGIPYAAPPVGELRWRAPQPVAKWEGVRKADEFGAMCVQAAQGGAQKMSEDCLYLNVFTAAARAGEKRPVMVWIHPGGYNGGNSAAPGYDGENFAKKGVVLVSINYRLGSLGFFSHPELTKESDHRWAGNQMFMDQCAALEWVKRNIAGFGGDPGNVTVFGDSAGGFSISNMLASPRAKGLFHRAIAQSGSWTGLVISPVRPLAEAEQDGLKLGASLKELRAMPAEDVIKNLRITSQTGPVVDGYFLFKTPQEVFARGEELRVPLIAGSNKDEGTFSQVPNTAAEWKQRAATRFGDMADAYLKLYPPGTDAETLRSQFDAYRDEVAWTDRNMVRLHAKSGQKGYLFYFTHEPPGPPLWPARGSGATHGGEAQFVFNNLLGGRPWRELDREVAQYMQAYWINFATKGDPNGPGLPVWAAYDDAKNVTPMVLGDKAEVGPAYDAAKWAFYQGYYSKVTAK